ncbi:MAG TPA: DNA repair protein, partial [Roseiflexaceae bacterium]|nr:DNA repair protein [Roseiflexaceae bacterium]
MARADALPVALAHLAALLDPHFSFEPHWWPLVNDDHPFEILVGSVLVQQTRWQTVEAALRRLLAADMLQPAALAAADPAELAAIIRPCAFHTQKAPGLIAISRVLCTEFGGDVRAMLAGERLAVRARLLTLPRIGRETADTVMLYAGDHALFVVDAYTRRLFSRVDLIPGFDCERAAYDLLQQQIELAVAQLAARQPGFEPLPFYRWLHALIVEACIHHCQATRPRCRLPGLRPTFVDAR